MSIASNCIFHPPSLEAWISAVSVHGGLSLLVGVPIGAVLYYVCNNTNENIVNKKPAVALFFGIITAISMACWPFKPYLDNLEHSWMAKFLASTFGFQTFFKSMAIAFDQCPIIIDINNNISLKDFIYWFVAIPEPVFAKGKFKRTTFTEIFTRATYFVLKICSLFVILTLLHILSADTTIITASKENESGNKIDNLLLLLLRGFLHIWFIYLWASFCLDFSSLSNTMLTGISSQEGFRNPLLCSRSLSEAWANRWNIPIHIFLKRSIYIPTRKAGYGRAVAYVFTFLVSGLLHEYNFSIHNTIAYEPGKATIFFVVMGLVAILEDWLLYKVVPFTPTWIQHVPSPVISTVLVLIVAAGPVEPLFIKSWLQAGAVDAVKELLPHMTCDSSFS